VVIYISGNVVESILGFLLYSCLHVVSSLSLSRARFLKTTHLKNGAASADGVIVIDRHGGFDAFAHLLHPRLSSHSGLYNRSSLSHRFAVTDEALRNVSAIFAFKADSWNSIFGSKANFMEHLSLLG
jgi:hypothetical protein